MRTRSGIGIADDLDPGGRIGLQILGKRCDLRLFGGADLRRTDTEEDIFTQCSRLLGGLRHRSLHGSGLLHGRFLLLGGLGSPGGGYGRGGDCRARFLIVLAEAEGEPGQRIELPVEVPGLLRVVFVGKHVGIQFHAERHAVRKAEIDAQPQASGHEDLAARPHVLERIALVVEGVGFVVTERPVHAHTREQVRIDRAAVVELAEQVGQVERHVDVALQIFILVDRLGRDPGAFALPAAQAEAHTPYGREPVPGVQRCGRRYQLAEIHFAERIGGTRLYLQEPMAFKLHFLFFLRRSSGQGCRAHRKCGDGT